MTLDVCERIHIVGFSRCGEPSKSSLQEGRELEVVRAEAASYGQSCFLKSRAAMFVFPDQYEPIFSMLGQRRLKPHHVAISEAFLPLLAAEVALILQGDPSGL